MIRKISAIIFVLVCILTTPAFSFDDDYRTYLTLGGGVTLLEETTQNHSVLADSITITGDQGFNGFIATGRAYDAGRVEFSLGFNQAEFKEYEAALAPGVKVDLEGNIKVVSFLVSVFWDFNTDGAVSPYFGGGVGVCQIRMDDTLLGENRDGAMAYQLGLGVSFDMGQNVQLDLGYKMLGIIEPNLGPIDPSYVTIHNGNAALRFLF